jgi:hypothetical protein
MLRRMILWWRLKQREKALKSLRDYQRTAPDDPKLNELIHVLEQQYGSLRAEQICRRTGWHFSFRCEFCGRQNISYVRPVSCRYCGKDAPTDLKLTDGKPDTQSGK